MYHTKGHFRETYDRAYNSPIIYIIIYRIFLNSVDALAEECPEFASPERTRQCRIWIEKDDEALSENGTLEVSLWALATTWGRYEDTVSIELHVGADILPAVHIPLVVHAITSPLEFPLSVDVHRPTVK